MAESERRRTRGNPVMRPLAEIYEGLFREAVAIFEGYDRDLINGFRQFQQRGVLELITCGTTHGYLPLLRNGLGTVEAQVGIAATAHERAFGAAARASGCRNVAITPG